MILNKEEKKRLVNNLSWMIKDIRYKYDVCKGNLEEGSQGDYSNELKASMQLLEDIQKTETIESTGCHRGSNLVNCREFKCPTNRSGICISSKITLESMGSHITGHLKCIEAQAKIKKEEK